MLFQSTFYGLIKDSKKLLGRDLKNNRYSYYFLENCFSGVIFLQNSVFQYNPSLKKYSSVKLLLVGTWVNSSL